MPLNEEEVKIKYIVPWLLSAGSDVDDLVFERTFSIRIGRRLLNVSGPSIASGRLDILVRRGSKNLFVVETKAEGVALDEHDRDQAISYARLVHPIAPYALVTNGRESRLYHSVTKEEIDPASIKVRGFDVVLPDEALFEAQGLFLGLNSANLPAFCRMQVESEIGRVKGNIAEGKKYVPELHVSRAAAFDKVKAFLDSPTPGLLMIGESGIGKTSEMCCIVDTMLAEGRAVLFFNGSQLGNQGILGAIGSEFAWTFSGNDSPIQAVKRLEACAGQAKLIIVVDAIDEWTHADRVTHLSTVLSAVEHRNIKLIASSKSSALAPFLSQRGVATSTSDLTARLELAPLTPREFDQALGKYREAYGFHGAFETAVLKQAQENPFLLRVLFDVAQASTAKHFTFDSLHFFEEYFHRATVKTHDPARAANTLKSVARALYEHDADTILEDELRMALQLTVNDRLMDELFEYNLLARGASGPGETVIGFYFQQLRDYLVGFCVARFHQMSARALLDEANAAKDRSVRGAALSLYYRLATPEHKRVLDSEVRANATKYLYCYRSLIEEHFPALESVFVPSGRGLVGFVGEFALPRLRVDLFGFRRLEPGDEEVHFVSTEGGWLHDSNLSYLAGAQDLHGFDSNPGFQGEFDIDAQVRSKEILEQLKTFVRQGWLNEAANADLQREFVLATVLKHKSIFSAVLTQDRQSIQFPLQLSNVLDGLRREVLTRDFTDEVVQEKRACGEIEEHWHGLSVSYSPTLTLAEHEAVQARVVKAAADGVQPSRLGRYSDLVELERRLPAAVHSLMSTQGDILRMPAYMELRAAVRRGSPVDRKVLEERLEALYIAFLANYRRLVEVNFPTLKSYFALYSAGPVAIFVEIGNEPFSGRGYNDMRLAIYFCRSRTADDLVRVSDKVLMRRSNGDLVVGVAETEYEPISSTRSSVASKFSRLTGLAVDPFEGMVLRGLVYSTLHAELPAVEAEFLERSQPH